LFGLFIYLFLFSVFFIKPFMLVTGNSNSYGPSFITVRSSIGFFFWVHQSDLSEELNLAETQAMTWMTMTSLTWSSVTVWLLHQQYLVMFCNLDSSAYGKAGGVLTK
jgi:hypothetical protein